MAVSNGELLELLINVESFLDDYVDVTDGPYGEPRPNRAMSLHYEVERAIEALEAR